MGKKKNGGGGGNNNNNSNGGNENKENVEKKKENPTLTVVLKVDFHCEGCACKIVKHLRSFRGVDSVKTEASANKVTVVGAVDPVILRDKLSQKTKKKVDLISPQPKKEENSEKKQNNPDQQKSPKGAQPATVVLKVALHCRGCIGRIRKTVSKTKGVYDVSIDEQKDLVTVKGTMDVKALTENLKGRLKRPVEIVPPKKEGGNNNNNNNNGGGGDGGKKNKGNGGGGGDAGKEGGQNNNGGGKLELGNINKLEYFPGFGFGFGYPIEQGSLPDYPMIPIPNFAPDYSVQVHAPQIFSDENPNACSIM